MLDSLFSFPDNVESSIFAIGQEGEQDISRAVKCSCKENEMVDKK